MGHWKGFFKNTLTLGGYNALVQVVNFAGFSIVSRYITPAESGVVALVLVFSGFLSVFSDAGISFAVMREDFDKTFLEKLNFLSMLIGIGLSLCLCVLAYPIAFFYEKSELFPICLVLSTVFFIQSSFLVSKARLQKGMEFGVIGSFLLIGAIANALLMVLMAYFGFSYWSLVFPQIVSLSLQAVFFIRKKPSKIVFLGFLEAKSVILEVKSLLSSVSGFNMINYWARNADNLLIGKVFGKDALGEYNHAYKLFVIPQSLVSTVISQVFLPTFKTLKTQNRNIESEYLKLEKVITVVMLAAVPLIVCPDLLVGVLFGEKWVAVADYLPFFGVCLLTQPIIAPISVLLILDNREDVLFKIGVFNAIIIVLAIIIGAFFSPLHIALFYTIAYLCISAPIVVYWAEVDTMDFRLWSVAKSWVPKLVFSLLIVIAQWMGLIDALLLLVVGYVFFVLIHSFYGIQYLLKILRNKME